MDRHAIPPCQSIVMVISACDRAGAGDGAQVPCACGSVHGLGLRDIVARAKKNAPHTLKIEVEVTTVEDGVEAVNAGADIIMLDNMSVEEIRRAVKSVGGRVILEASGGITLENVRAVAETGVDLISIGALTHSVKALDISLELEV